MPVTHLRPDPVVKYKLPMVKRWGLPTTTTNKESKNMTSVHWWDCWQVVYILTTWTFTLVMCTCPVVAFSVYTRMGRVGYCYSLVSILATIITLWSYELEGDIVLRWPGRWLFRVNKLQIGESPNSFYIINSNITILSSGLFVVSLHNQTLGCTFCRLTYVYSL